VQAESLLTIVATLQFRVSEVGGAIGYLKSQSASKLDKVDPSKGVEARHETKPCLLGVCPTDVAFHSICKAEKLWHRQWNSKA
jgi:hypothetical protein